MKSVGTWADKVLTQGRPLNTKPPLFHVGLVEPEIPQNTGNIGRTCVATHSELHIFGKTGFDITDSNLKRAGLDYWEHLTWTHHPEGSPEAYVAGGSKAYYFSAKADRHYTECEFRQGDWFVFGRETKGLPEDLMLRNSESLVLIPLLGPARGLNLATAVAIALYEGIRQIQVRGQLDATYLEVPWGKL